MKRPLISIITPCYNMGQFISECIESVLVQDYPHVEHIIQDGSSTDNTISVLKKYSKYQTVKWESEKDSGQADGLNRALQRSIGDILLVLNGDDVLLPYACSWAATYFQLYSKMAVIYGDVFVIDKHGKIIKYANGSSYNFKRLFCVKLVPPAQAAFIQRSYLKKVGFYADTSLDTCPDFEMWIRIGMKYPMLHIPGAISKYRSWSHPDSHAPRSVLRFYQAKKFVINRTLSYHRAPPEIRRLKHEAYQGLALWSAHQAIENKNFQQSVYFIRLAFLNRIDKYLLKTMLNYFIDSPFMVIKIMLSVLLG